MELGDGDTIRLESPFGTAEANAAGGILTQWKPRDSEAVFAMARPYAEMVRDGTVHGGLPICWPWAVHEGPAGCRIHGLARYARWRVASRAQDRVTFALDDDAATRAEWPHAFHLELEYALGQTLRATFRATNTGREPFACTELFHPYFRTGETARCTVTGTDGARYFRRDEAALGDGRVWRGDFPGAFFTGRAPGVVFEWPHDAHAAQRGADGTASAGADARTVTFGLRDPLLRRTLTVRYTGAIKGVIWNSGPDFSAYGVSDTADFGRRFLCVEAGTLYRDRAYVLAPGATHVLGLEVACQPLPETDCGVAR